MSTHAEIIVREGARALGRYVLDPGDYVIGKDLSCDILLDIAGISPRHTQVTVTPDGLLVRDLESTNGTYLGERVVEGSTAVAWGDSIRLGSHGSAEFRLLKRKAPVATNGTAKGKERKNGGSETAELKSALAGAQIERDAARKKEKELAAQHEKTTHELTVMQEELDRTREDAAKLGAERDDAWARWSATTTTGEKRITELSREGEELRAALAKAQAAAAETAERQRMEIEARVAERDAGRRESDDAALIFAQQLAIVEAQVQSLQEERANLTAENADILAELGDLVESQKSQIEALSRERDQAIIEKDARLADVPRVAAAHRHEIELLTEQRDSLARESAEAAQRAAIAAEAARQHAQSYEADRVLIIEEKAAVTGEFEKVIDGQRRQIEALTHQRNFVINERNEAFLRTDKLTEERQRDLGALVAQRAALLRERDEAVARFTGLGEENARQIEEITRQRDALAEERNKALAEHSETRQAMLRATDALGLEHRTALTERDEAAAGLQRIVEAQQQQIDALKADALAASGDKNAQIEKLRAETVAATARSTDVQAEWQAANEVQAQRVRLLNQQLAQLTAEKDQSVADLTALVEMQKKEIGSFAEEREGLVRAREAAVSQLTAAAAAQAAQLAALGTQRDDLGRERDAALARFVEAANAREEHVAALVQERDALLGARDQSTTLFAEVSDSLKQQVSALNGAAEASRQEHAATLAQLEKVIGDQKAQSALLLKQRDEATTKFDQERERRAREFTSMQQDRATLIEERDEKMKGWGLAELALKQEIEAVTRAAEVARQEHEATLAQLEKVSGDTKVQIALLLKERDEAAAKFDQERERSAREFTALQQDRAALIAQRDEKGKEWGATELALKQEIEAVTRAAEVARHEHEGVLAQLEKVAADQKAQIASLLRQFDEAAAKFDREREERAREVSMMLQEKAALIAQHDEKRKEGALAEQAWKQEIDAREAQRDDAARERDQARSELAAATAAHQAQLVALEAHRTALVQDRDEALARFAEINQAQVKQLDSLRKQREAGVKQKEDTIVQLTQTSRAQQEQLASLIKERDSALREKAAIVAELTRLNEAQQQQIETIESDRLGLHQQHEETFGRLTAVNSTQREQIEALEQQRLLAIREKDAALVQHAQVTGGHQKRIDELLHDRQIVERERDLANEKLGRIHGEHRAGVEALVQEREGLFANLAGLRAECDSAQRERDETLSMVTRLKEHHRLDLSALAQEREALVEARDRAIVRLESVLGDARGEDELAKARAIHKAEIEKLLEHQKKLRAERDEAMGRLEHQKESQKLELEKLARERLDLVDQRDRFAVQLEAAHEEVKQAARNFETTRENLIKERDKAVALRNEAREVQKQFQDTFAENSSLAQELATVEQALRGIANGQPAGQEGASSIGKILSGLKSKLIEARRKGEEVGRLETFELSTAERLLNRHKYEFGGEISSDLSLVRIRAKDVNIDRVVEMKIVAAVADSREETIAQLIDEARMIGRLEHPNIQPMYDLGVDETGRAFYTTKLINGSCLDRILEELHAKKAGALVHFDLKRLLTIVDSVCDAIAFAHEEGFAHGHLTADAVQVGEFGEVLVTGWEKAKKIRRENVTTYQEDIRVDLAGLGDLLYHILTLTTPVPGEAKSVRPDKQWNVPKGLWRLTLRIRADRAATAYPRVKQMQMEIREFRDELGPRGGRASAFDTVNQYLHKWQ